MGFLWHILLGVVIGVLARFIHPGKENMGWFMTILIGVVGSVLAGLIGQFLGWYAIPSFIGFIVGVVLAVILIALYAKFKSNRAKKKAAG